MNIKFECPKCGSKTVEEVMIGITQYSNIDVIDVIDVNDVDDEDDNVYIDYGGISYEGEDGEIDRYQCAECGFVLPLCNDGHDLAEWCKENCRQE